MKIAIYSGCFDPPTLGHKWVIDTIKPHYNQVHVVIGPNYTKKPTFTEDERRHMIQSMYPTWAPQLDGTMVSCTSMCRLKIGAVQDVLEYVEKLKIEPLAQVTMIRGVRNAEDFEYEQNIAYTVEQEIGVPTLFVACPPGMDHISSSHVKDLCFQGKWSEVGACVDKEVFTRLAMHFDTGISDWVFIPHKPPSIFEQTTAGFAPTPYKPKDGWPSDDGCSLQQMASGSYTDFYDDPVVSQYARHILLDRMRDFFNKMKSAGLFHYTQTITQQQVRQFLDPCSVDVVASEEFHLKEVPVDALSAFGYRWEACSRSLGPIIVETNHFADDPCYGRLGPNVIIEGKHRWLDAKERKEKTIWAWCGNLTKL